MTRAEIDSAVMAAGVQFGKAITADSVLVILKTLGLLVVDPEPDDAKAAIEQLARKFTIVVDPTVHGTGLPLSAKMTKEGAIEIVDILTKSGFRITRDK